MYIGVHNQGQKIGLGRKLKLVLCLLLNPLVMRMDKDFLYSTSLLNLNRSRGLFVFFVFFLYSSEGGWEWEGTSTQVGK